MKDKDWFISQYTQIHDNLNSIEREIENHLEENKNRIVTEYTTLENLKDRAKKEVERLEKTREEEKKYWARLE